jgi:hypothetical protein
MTICTPGANEKDICFQNMNILGQPLKRVLMDIFLKSKDSTKHGIDTSYFGAGRNKLWRSDLLIESCNSDLSLTLS